MTDIEPWSDDWIWSVPLIITTVVIHICGFGLASIRTVQLLNGHIRRRHPAPLFLFVLGTLVLLAIVLHASEAAIWAAAYWWLGALPDTRSAMLYSLEAMTTFGHAPIMLNPHWRMMGALEALNGMLLFGLSTAILFSVIQRTWLSRPYARAAPR
jgi:hypothetical protein